MAFTNSKLAKHRKLSPNHSGKRTKSISRISPHCVVGQLSYGTIGSIFASKSRPASCNYGIDKNGEVILIVEEKNRSWCTSSNDNDQRAVTIEIASDTKHPYAMNKKAYEKFIELCVDICKRNGKTKLLWFGNKDKTLNYKPKVDEMVLTVHRWFANKSCPGDWLYSRLDDVAKEVTERLGTKTTTAKEETAKKETFKSYKVKITAKTLNVRAGAGTKHKVVTTVKKNEVYTIVEEKMNGKTKWLKLKSGAGWISANYTKKV